MKIRNVIASAAFACAILSLSTYKVKAADVSQSVKNFSARTNISLNKTWTVKLSDEIDEKTIGDNIKVVDKATGNPVNVTVKLNSDKKSVQIEAPSVGYEIDKNYSVLVGNKVCNLKGKNLSQGAELDFTTASIKSIDNIKDVNTAIGTVPKLPSSVNAVLTDGTTKAFEVAWVSLSQDYVSKAGTIDLNGILKGTKYSVSLKVVVSDIEFLKKVSNFLGDMEPIIQNSSEKNVVVVLKAAIDAKIADPSQSLDVQAAKSTYHGLSDLNKIELQSIMLQHNIFSLQELSQIKSFIQ